MSLIIRGGPPADHPVVAAQRSAGPAQTALARASGRVAHLAVSVTPNSKLPGTAQLTSLVGGMMTWVLLACVAAILIGAAAWGFGQRASHFTATQHGRTMVVGGVIGAMVTGAAAALVNYGFGLGGAVH